MVERLVKNQDMEDINTNLLTKIIGERLIRNRDIAEFHAELVSKPQFRQLMDVALLELMDQLDNSINMPADVRYWQLSGAREFVRLLQRMHLPVQPIDTELSDNLSV